jgi:hypothetical protein
MSGALDAKTFVERRIQWRVETSLARLGTTSMDQISAADARTRIGCVIRSCLLLRPFGRGRVRLAVSTLGIVSFAAAVLPTASAKTFPPYGARGDASFSDTCPAGQYLVGLRVRSGAWIDQMAISCRSLTGNVGGPFYGPARGGNGGEPSEEHCPAGQVVNYMAFGLTAGDRQVNHFFLECISVTEGSKGHSMRIGPAVSTNTPPQRQPCPAGEAATGIAGRYGKHVNAVGLICSKLAVPPPASHPAGHPPQPK